MQTENRSLKYKFTGENTQKIAMYLMRNQNICRYIEYLDDYPLSDTKEDVKKNMIASGNIEFKIFQPKIYDKQQVTLFFNPRRNSFNRNNALGTDAYFIHIVVPVANEIVDEDCMYRAYGIAREIAKEIDQQTVAGLGDVITGDSDYYYINETYVCLSMNVYIENACVKE